MPPTQADLDEFDAWLKPIALIDSTQFEQQQTRFKSIDEALKYRAHLAGLVAAAAAASTGVTRSRVAGFCGKGA
jgi:hypothetical protein